MRLGGLDLVSGVVLRRKREDFKQNTSIFSDSMKETLHEREFIMKFVVDFRQQDVLHCTLSPAHEDSCCLDDILLKGKNGC